MHGKAPFISARLSESNIRIFDNGPIQWDPTLGLSSVDLAAPDTTGTRYLDENSHTFCTSFWMLSHCIPVLDALPLSQVSTLVLDYCHSEWSTTQPLLLNLWHPLSSAMTNLTALDIKGFMTAKAFLGMLKRSMKAPNTTPLFPKLERVRFVDVPFTYVEGAVNSAGDAEGPEAVDWFSQGCPCREWSWGYDEPCSCNLAGLGCGCETGVICDCECKWLDQELAKLLIDALRARDAAGLPRLRYVEIVVTEIVRVRGPAEYTLDALGGLIDGTLLFTTNPR